MIAAQPIGGILADSPASRTERRNTSMPAAGLYPFVRLIEAGGGVYPEAERFLAGVKSER